MKTHRSNKLSLSTTVLLLTLAGAFPFIASCGDDDCTTCPPDDGARAPQFTEEQVLENLELAWDSRNLDDYADLLADDFRFFPDADTRQLLELDSWDRDAELVRVGCLFASQDVAGLTIRLNQGTQVPVSAGYIGTRESWTRMFLTDIFVDIDVARPGEEVNTYRVEDHAQRFYFRKGRTFPPSSAADTLVYLVEWRDEGSPDRKPSPVPVLSTSWSLLKLLIEGCGE